MVSKGTWSKKNWDVCPKELLDISENDWKYFAGIFDAEGCVHLQKRQLGIASPLLQIQIAQKNLNFLSWLKMKFGGNVYWKSNYKWIETSARAYWILIIIYPYLIIKKEDVDIIFDYVDVRKTASFKRGYEIVRLSNFATIKEHLRHYHKDRNKDKKLTKFETTRIKNTNMSAPYLAGFFDGDGHLGLYGKKGSGYNLVCHISQTGEKGRLWFKNLSLNFCGKMSNIKKEKDKHNHYGFLFTASGNGVLSFLVEIFRFVIIKEKLVMEVGLKTLGLKNFFYIKGFYTKEEQRKLGFLLIKTKELNSKKCLEQYY